MTFQDLLVILGSEKPSDTLTKRKEELFKLIPELKESDGFNQNNPWHVYDVFEHIMHVVDGVSNNYVSRLSALFHDIGKPFVYTEDENHVGHFYNHWSISKEIFLKFAKKHHLDEKSTQLISKIIFYHDLGIKTLNEVDYKAFLKEFNSDEMKLLFDLKKSDLLAQNPKYHYLLEEYEDTLKKILNNYI